MAEGSIVAHIWVSIGAASGYHETICSRPGVLGYLGIRRRVFSAREQCQECAGLASADSAANER